MIEIEIHGRDLHSQWIWDRIHEHPVLHFPDSGIVQIPFQHALVPEKNGTVRRIQQHHGAIHPQYGEGSAEIAHSTVKIHGIPIGDGHIVAGNDLYLVV